MLKDKNVRMLGKIKLVSKEGEIGFEDLQGENVELEYDKVILSLVQGCGINGEKNSFLFSNLGA